MQSLQDWSCLKHQYSDASGTVATLGPDDQPVSNITPGTCKFVGLVDQPSQAGSYSDPNSSPQHDYRENVSHESVEHISASQSRCCLGNPKYFNCSCPVPMTRRDSPPGTAAFITWVVLRVRVPFRILFIRVPYLFWGT